VSYEPIASVAAASISAATAPSATDAASTPAAQPGYIVVSQDVTAIMPPGYTQTQTTKADGTVTTVITNATGGTVDTIYGTSTMDTAGSQVSLWA
jgi:hypothetical protein